MPSVTQIFGPQLRSGIFSCFPLNGKTFCREAAVLVQPVIKSFNFVDSLTMERSKNLAIKKNKIKKLTQIQNTGFLLASLIGCTIELIISYVQGI